MGHEDQGKIKASIQLCTLHERVELLSNFYKSDDSIDMQILEQKDMTTLYKKFSEIKPLLERETGDELQEKLRYLDNHFNQWPYLQKTG